jgi:hypothetical protein
VTCRRASHAREARTLIKQSRVTHRSQSDGQVARARIRCGHTARRLGSPGPYQVPGAIRPRRQGCTCYEKMRDEKMVLDDFRPISLLSLRGTHLSNNCQRDLRYRVLIIPLGIRGVLWMKPRGILTGLLLFEFALAPVGLRIEWGSAERGARLAVRFPGYRFGKGTGF